MSITLDNILAIRPWSSDDHDTVQVGPLTVLPWESERTDVHGIGSVRTEWAGDRRRVSLLCHCGHRESAIADTIHLADRHALDGLFAHARMTCAVCHQSKPADDFPRCSACAF